MIDTHCHLTYSGLYERVDDVLAQAYQVGVDRMICVGTTAEDSDKSVALARRYESVYATVGIHPHHVDEVLDVEQTFHRLTRLVLDPKVVAVGEMGLDYHYDRPSAESQQRVLGYQLEWATGGKNADKQVAEKIKKLPIIIHNREATADVLGMLRVAGIASERCVFHCFTGTQQELDAILGFGAMVSFTGIITFKNARTLAALAAQVPMDRFMIETDSPYLTPEPYRKVKTNEPRYVAEVATFLAQARKMDRDELIEAVDANACRFFGLLSR